MTVAQGSFTGTFAFSTAAAGSAGSCANIASETQAGSSATYTITPLANGHCTYLVTGGGGKSATLTIDVTVTNVGGH